MFPNTKKAVLCNHNMKIHRIILLFLFICLYAIGYHAEQIPVNKGMGWDGKHYANLAINFDSLAIHRQIDHYQYQRILTPVLIHYACKAVGYNLTTDSVVGVFALYNFALLIGCCFIFFSLSNFLKLQTSIECIGFAALFYNYFILKNTPYYPVLTDVSAFFAGMSLTFFFVKNRPKAMGIVLFLGHFCFPLFLLSSTPLLLNSRKNSLFYYVNVKLWVYAIIALLVTGFAFILFYPNLLLPQYTLALNRYALPLSIFLIVAFILRAFIPFQKSNRASTSFNPLPFTLIAAGVALFYLVCTVLIKQISIPEEVFTPKVFLFNILQQAIDNPLVSIISHVIYLGPAILIIIWKYPFFVRTIQSFGDSAIVYFLIIVLLSIGSETRQFIHFYPFLIMMLLITLNQFPISMKQSALFVMLSICVSQFWLTINTPAIFAQYDYGHFPDQAYFMHHGPFMSDLSYLLNAGVLLLNGLFVYLLFQKPLKLQTNFTDSTSPSL